MVPLVALFVCLVFGAYAAFSRLLAHRERMAELESRRPHVVLQLPAGTSQGAEQLTEEIFAACRAKGIDVDLEVR